MKRSLFIFVIAAAVSACSAYPQHGTGGFAEHRATVDPHYVWGERNWAEDVLAEPFQYADDRRFARIHGEGWTTWQISRLDCADLRIDALRARGANKVYPALVWKAERDRRRALRTLSGGLEWDGERELSAYEDTLEELAGRLGILVQDVRDTGPNPAMGDVTCSPVASPRS